MGEGAVVGWLMEGDPVIRWQVMRDLLDSAQAGWQTERERTLSEGWGARFLECRNSDDEWPAGRWTGTPWVLLTLIDCGIPASDERASGVAKRFLDRVLPGERAESEAARVDLCHVGFWLRIAAYFAPEDERIPIFVEALLGSQMGDGGWNCQCRKARNVVHSSFHTTFNAVEGLALAADAGLLDRERFRAAEARALEFMLAHRMYKSDKTGAVVSDRFTHLTFPSYWHYTVLRGLDYMRRTPEIHDPRLADAIGLLESQRDVNGRWIVEKRIAGIVHFDMEPLGKPSRWNTLRSLRVLKAHAGNFQQ